MKNQAAPELATGLHVNTESPETTTLDRRMLKICDAIGAFIEWWGFRAIHGRVWTILALSNNPLAQNEIASKLGVSRSLVSPAIAQLQDFGLVRSISERRNTPYTATLDFWPTITDILRTREWMLIEAIRQSLEGAIEEAEWAIIRGNENPYDLERMRSLLRMTETAQSFLKMLVSLRVPKSMDSLTAWAGKAAGILKAMRSA